MYICAKLPLRDLNSDSYPQHPTSAYTCKVTIAPRICGDVHAIIQMFVDVILTTCDLFLKRTMEEIYTNPDAY